MPKRIDDDRVYTTVCQLFVEYGYDGLTTKVLAERAGINEVSLFRRYRSKAELVCSAVNRALSRVPLAKLRRTGGLVVDLESIVTAYISTVRTYGPLLPVLMIELKRQPDLAGAFDAARANIKSMLAIIEDYVEDGSLFGDAMDLLGVLLGPLLVRSLIPLEPEIPTSPLPEVHQYVERFLTGHRNTPDNR